jgi:predicted aspartyl protease
MALSVAAQESTLMPQTKYSREADKSQTILAIYRVTILWDGDEREIDVLDLPEAPLIGMSLLDGYDVRIQAVDGGIITIELL